MNYSLSYFGKSIDEVSVEDIISFFNEPREESTKIEFKSFSNTYGNFNQNLDGIIRGICAMLNSEGGIIIWGAPEGHIEPKRKEKVFQGKLAAVTEYKSKDWLISKISDSITPLPTGIKVSILKHDNLFVYVFEIQQSTYPPHQFKHTYFARLDGQSKPAPHYLINALFKKVTFPQIEGYLKIDNIQYDHSIFILEVGIVLFNFTPLQNEETVVFKLLCSQGVFEASQDLNILNRYTEDGHQYVSDDDIKILHYGEPYYHSERIILNKKDLIEKYNNEVDLLLSFGGKNSPIKTSDYTLDFNRIKIGHQNNPNEIISRKDENVMLVDRQLALGTTRESAIKAILGR
ncbi:MAG: ATP-binding protein [Bacteroidetes bacterium]|uniref:AlbA family DNA-binding domain-containing protein n=1 Tax=Phnomibacter sp. TaxID=2836217 RepID=UPI002FDD6A9D|nr:ATP-binding protein [Bacteroidota bacterium]